MTAITIDAGPNYFTRINRPGFSVASEELDKFLAEQIEDLQRSETWSKRSAVYALDRSYLTSAAVNPEVERKYLRRAADFLTMLPEWVTTPDAYVDEDGDLGFEWCFGDSRRVSVILELDDLIQYDKIQYAALFPDGSRTYGTEMVDDEIPDSIIECIKKAMG